MIAGDLDVLSAASNDQMKLDERLQRWGGTHSDGKVDVRPCGVKQPHVATRKVIL